MGISLYGRLIESIYRATLNGLQDIFKINSITVALCLIKYFLLHYLLTNVSNKVEFVFLVLFLISIITIIIFRILTYSSIEKISKSDIYNKNCVFKLSASYNYTLGMAIISIQSIFLGQIDKIILSTILTLSEFGLYSIIISIASIVFVSIFPIVNTFGPKACELRASNKHREIRLYYHATTKIISVIIGSVGMIVIYYTEVIVRLWLGNINISTDTITNIKLIVIGNIINGLCWLPFQLQNAYGWIRYGIISNGLTALFIVPILLYITPQYGIEGASYVWIVLNIFYITIGIFIMHRKIFKKEMLKWYFEDIFPPIITQIALNYLIISYIKISNYENIIQYGLIIFILIANLLFSWLSFGLLIVCKRKSG